MTCSTTPLTSSTSQTVILSGGIEHVNIITPSRTTAGHALSLAVTRTSCPPSAMIIFAVVIVIFYASTRTVFPCIALTFTYVTLSIAVQTNIALGGVPPHLWHNPLPAHVWHVPSPSQKLHVHIPVPLQFQHFPSIH